MTKNTQHRRLIDNKINDKTSGLIFKLVLTASGLTYIINMIITSRS